MKLKSDNHTRQISRLQRSVNDLSLDIQAIREEHDRYVLKGSNDEIMGWFHSLPIETLSESCDRERAKPRTKYSLHDMKYKFALRKLHELKKDQLEKEQIKLSLAKIDKVIVQIERIENGTYEPDSGRDKRRKTSPKQKVGRS